MNKEETSRLKEMVNAAFDESDEEASEKEEEEPIQEKKVPAPAPAHTTNGIHLKKMMKVLKTTPANTVRSRRNPEKKIKKRRWRPGTVPLREIKRYQKTSALIIPRGVMNRTVRRHVQQHSPAAQLANGTVEAIQQFVESEMVKLAKCSQELALAAGRITVYGQDAQMYQKVRFRTRR